MSKKQDREAFEDFMSKLVKGIVGGNPDFKVKFHHLSDDEMGKIDKVVQESEEDEHEANAHFALAGDDSEEDSEGHVSTTITFSVSGPSFFADEISRDVYRLLRGLRNDALNYAEKKFGDEADSVVSVSVDFSTGII